MRPILRPGTHVLSRGNGELQVGLDPRQALVLPDTAPVRECLRLLASPADQRPGSDPADRGLVGLLDEHGLLVDERALLPLLGSSGLPRPATAALVRAAGAGVDTVTSRRARWRAETAAFGHAGGADALHEELVELLRGVGLGQRSGRSSPDCGVLVGVGEPHRERLDEWIRSGTPHLLVRLTEGRAVVGPFVVPGRTACLRCLDAHHTDADPAWPLLVRQYATASARDRADGAPEPVDPLLATQALAWAARDVAAYADGLRPSTWSTTVTLDARPDQLETSAWLRHPACCCSWQ